MSLIDKKNSLSPKPVSKVKLISIVVASFFSLSAIGGALWFLNEDKGAIETQVGLPSSETNVLVKSLNNLNDMAASDQAALDSGDIKISDNKLIRSREDLDKVSIDISRRFFGGRLVEYIEFNTASGLYAVIPSGSADVYFVNSDKNVVIKGDAYLVAGSSAVLINDEIRTSHKNSFKQSVDVLSLVGGSKNKKNDEVVSDSSLGDITTAADIDKKDSFNIKAPVDAEPKVAVRGDDQSYDQKTQENGTSSEIAGDNLILDKLANGETVRPLREPTEDEVEAIKTKTEEESAKILFGQKLKDDYLIVYNPPKGVDTVATINVFADPECPSCKKLHKDVNNLLGLGVKVRYITMPRRGLDSSIAKQMAVAFCSPNKQDVFDSLFSGKRYDTDVDGFESCFSLVSKNANLGYSLGIKHTPTIYSSDTGKIFEGYPSGNSAYIDLLDKLGVTNLLGKK